MKKLLLIFTGLILISLNVFSSETVGRNVFCEMLVNEQAFDVNLDLKANYNFYEKVLDETNSWVGLTDDLYDTGDTEVTVKVINNGKLVEESKSYKTWMSVIDITDSKVSYSVKISEIGSFHISIDLTKELEEPRVSKFENVHKIRPAYVKNTSNGQYYKTKCGVANWR